MNICQDKKYVTKGGHNVVIHTVSGKNPQYPVVGEILLSLRWMAMTWAADGQHLHTNDKIYDLVEYVDPALVAAREYYILKAIIEDKDRQSEIRSGIYDVILYQFLAGVEWARENKDVI